MLSNLQVGLMTDLISVSIFSRQKQPAELAKYPSLEKYATLSSAIRATLIAGSRHLEIYLPFVFLDFAKHDAAHVEINSVSMYHMTLDSACYMMFQTNVESSARSIEEFLQTGEKLSINLKCTYHTPPVAPSEKDNGVSRRYKVAPTARARVLGKSRKIRNCEISQRPLRTSEQSTNFTRIRKVCRFRRNGISEIRFLRQRSYTSRGLFADLVTPAVEYSTQERHYTRRSLRKYAHGFIGR